MSTQQHPQQRNRNSSHSSSSGISVAPETKILYLEDIPPDQSPNSDSHLDFSDYHFQPLTYDPDPDAAPHHTKELRWLPESTDRADSPIPEHKYSPRWKSPTPSMVMRWRCKPPVYPKCEPIPSGHLDPGIVKEALRSEWQSPTPSEMQSWRCRFAESPPREPTYSESASSGSVSYPGRISPGSSASEPPSPSSPPAPQPSPQPPHRRKPSHQTRTTTKHPSHTTQPQQLDLPAQAVFAALGCQPPVLSPQHLAVLAAEKAQKASKRAAREEAKQARIDCMRSNMQNPSLWNRARAWLAGLIAPDPAYTKPFPPPPCRPPPPVPVLRVG